MENKIGSRKLEDGKEKINGEEGKGNIAHGLRQEGKYKLAHGTLTDILLNLVGADPLHGFDGLRQGMGNKIGNRKSVVSRGRGRGR